LFGKFPAAGRAFAELGVRVTGFEFPIELVDIKEIIIPTKARNRKIHITALSPAFPI
jgi:hypothetical protein